MLRRKSSVGYRLTRMAHDLLDGHLLWLPQSMTKRFQGATTVIRTIDAVDLERSRAFVPGTDGVIVVKSKEDERAIISGLSALKDESGRRYARSTLGTRSTRAAGWTRPQSCLSSRATTSTSRPTRSAAA